MPEDFLDHLSHDAISTFLADFGEWIEFEPYKEEPHKLLALIERDAATKIPGLTGASSYKHEVMIANAHPPAGRRAIQTGKDAVWFANRVGGKKERFIVMKVPENDQGVWLLEVG